MPQWVTLARWIHMLSGAAWFGEICLMAFVLVPRATALRGVARKQFIATVFPGVFRMASYFVIATLASGLWLNYLLTGWRRLDAYLATRHGALIAIGGTLGLIIAAVHFLVANQIETRYLSAGLSPRAEARLFRALRVIPWIGLFAITLSFILMMITARGF
ncbi:MAG: hypothetical protein WD751_07190 [Anaerolineales bacterium]